MPISPKWNHSAPEGTVAFWTLQFRLRNACPTLLIWTTGEEANLEKLLLLSFLTSEVALAPQRGLKILPPYFWAWKFCEIETVRKGRGLKSRSRTRWRCTFQVQCVNEPNWMRKVHSKLVSLHTLGKSQFSDPADPCGNKLQRCQIVFLKKRQKSQDLSEIF